MKTNTSFILLVLLKVLFISSCVTTKNVSQKVTNSYTSNEIKQYIQERFLHASDSLKIGAMFILDGIPYYEESDVNEHTIDSELKKYDKAAIRTIYFVNASKLHIVCRSYDFDLIPIIRTNENKQKRKAKKEMLTWVKDRYVGEHRTVNHKPLVIFNRKPLTTKTAFQLLQTLKIKHIDFIQKYEESQVIAGFEHISKNGVVEIFTK
ncbi:hypothetical protein [Kordia sp.]|uniref:hypothetical protein n=1 Tax=Kordia sp. TaxID=1965332 RepID=UPI003D6B8A90